MIVGVEYIERYKVRKFVVIPDGLKGEELVEYLEENVRDLECEGCVEETELMMHPSKDDIYVEILNIYKEDEL
ncbi:MAG: hypothetical protein ACTSQE_17020 [Candidatus Heimdallarchaeaceae archaeon]